MMSNKYKNYVELIACSKKVFNCTSVLSLNCKLAFVGILISLSYAFFRTLYIPLEVQYVPDLMNRFFVVTIIVGTLFLFSGFLIFASKQYGFGNSTTLIIIFVFAVLFRAELTGQDPWLSNDIYRYLWDAKLSDNGINPFAFPPIADELIEQRDEVIYANMDHKEVYTVYPPLLQFLFWIGLKLGEVSHWGAIIGLKSIFVLIDLGLVLYLFKILPQFKLAPQWAILYAWHPLPIIEIASSGHSDGIGALTLGMCRLFSIQSKVHMGKSFLSVRLFD